MQAAKFLERASVIRFFGICLLLAPFISMAGHAYLRSHKTKVTMAVIWNSLTVGTFSQNMQNILSVSSVVIGIIMLFGTRKAWSFVLGLIGFHIVIQTTTLLRDLKESWFWGGVFVVNLAVFFFIADQLVFKERRDNDDLKKPVMPPKSQEENHQSAPQDFAVSGTSGTLASHLPTTENTAPLPTTFSPQAPTPYEETSPTTLTTRKRIIIHFSDLQLWAQLMHISNEGLLVRAFENQTISLTDKPMAVFLRQDLPLRLQLSKVQENEYFFKFLPMSALEIQQLNLWILEKADVKRGSSKDAFNSLSFNKKVS